MKAFLSVALAICFFPSCFAQNEEETGQNPFQSSYVKPQHILQKEPGHYFIDFGKDAFGSLVLNFNAEQDDSLIIHLGEKLSDKNTIDTKPGGTIRYQKIVLKEVPLNKQFRVELPPDGRNDKYPAVMLPDTFGRVMPFRYCEIENLGAPINKVAIAQKVFNLRFNDDASSFTCSDTVLNRIWELCKHTIKATSFCGKYIDGDRERIPYEADALINQLSHYAVDCEYTLAQQTNEYFIDHPTWPTEWILHTVLLFYYDYLYTGDIQYLAKYYEPLKHKTLMALAREDGLISSYSPRLNKELMKKVGFDMNYTGRKIEDIVDWPHGERDGYEMTGINTVVNSFYYINLKRMSEIAAALGKKEDAEFYHNQSLVVKKSINEKLLDPGSGIYIDGQGSAHSSLHANMLPLAFGIVPEGNRAKVVSFIKSRGMACSVYGAQYLLEALYNAGEADYALGLMNTTIGDRNWWNMIRLGSTMTLEAWDAKYKSNLDWNHAWGTAPANIITRCMWGITPLEPGFGKVSIKPQLSGLTSSSIKVPTIKGPIHVRYEKINNRLIYDVNLPLGMKGEFFPAGSEIQKIILNGNPIAKKGSLQIKEGTNKIEIRLN